MALTRVNMKSADMPTGSVLQVKSVHSTTQKSITALHTTDGEAAGYSITITPTASTSTFLILVKLSTSTPDGNYIGYRLRRGSTEIAGGSGETYNAHTIGYYNGDAGNDGDTIAPAMGMFEDDPDTSSDITYSINAFVTGGTGYINRRETDDTNVSSSMTIMEIAG